MIVDPNAGKKEGLAASLNMANFDGILAVGGKGTLFEVINGLFKNNNKLRIPIGQIDQSGNEYRAIVSR